jgi:phosphosulfolactate synthase
MLDFLTLPIRPLKPRNFGITHVIDRGIGLNQMRDLLETSADYIDLLKLGWSTGYLTPNLIDKINLYKDYGIKVCFGGTLFELAVSQGKLDEYRRILLQFGITHVEVSNGTIERMGRAKQHYIRILAKDFVVLSEVGSKDKSKIPDPDQWIGEMQADLEAGAWKVIAEARESGTAGLFYANGEIRSELFERIVHEIDPDKIIFEAPEQSQQACLIQELGYRVNLGNIATNDVIPLETLRLGIRSDTMKPRQEKKVVVPDFVMDYCI